jgi:uncharacterized protein with HEPN domain
MDEADLIRLRHMLEAAEAGVSFIENESREALDTDQKLVFALVRAVQIVGEAATKISQETRAQYPEIPWKNITGTRHILVHDYFKISLDRIWQTAVDDLPPLIEQLKAIITALDDDIKS